MDAETAARLHALRLQVEWGADEALLDAPLDRLVAPQPPPPAAAAATPPAQPTPPALPAQPGPRPVASVARVGRIGAGRGDADAAGEMAAAADSLEALGAALRAFDPDGLAATATSLVFATDPARADLALVGDVPGADEDRAGAPFAGRAGALLDRMLASIGLDRGQVLLAHVVPWRPPGGRPASEAELAAFIPFLHRFLVLGGARRLLLLGAVPPRALFGREASLSRLRGRWRPATLAGRAELVPALPTFAPAQLLARPELKRASWADWRLLRRALDQA